MLDASFIPGWKCVVYSDEELLYEDIEFITSFIGEDSRSSYLNETRRFLIQFSENGINKMNKMLRKYNNNFSFAIVQDNVIQFVLYNEQYKYDSECIDVLCDYSINQEFLRTLFYFYDPKYLL